MSIDRPRLLFVTPVRPSLGGNGLAMRQGQFLAAYAKDFSVDVAVIPVAGGGPYGSQFAEALAHRFRQFELSEPDGFFALLQRLKEPAARLAAFQAYGRPSITARWTAHVQREFAGWVAGENYRMVHIGRLYLLELAGLCGCPWVVDADEDDAVVHQQFAAACTRQARLHEGAWLQAEAVHFSSLTARLLPGAAQVFTASGPDAATLSVYGRPLRVIPNVARRPRVVTLKQREPRLLFVGTMGYRPNHEAMLWFIKHCWPGLRKTFPGLYLDIVGVGAEDDLRRLAQQPGITWHSWQQNLSKFYARASIVIVPVHAGGGSRIKMLEAAAFGCPIVATSAGAAGTDLLPGRDFIRADDPAKFTQAVRQALRHARRLGAAARRAVERRHNPAVWQTKIRAIASKLGV